MNQNKFLLYPSDDANTTFIILKNKLDDLLLKKLLYLQRNHTILEQIINKINWWLYHSYIVNLINTLAWLSKDKIEILWDEFLVYDLNIKLFSNNTIITNVKGKKISIEWFFNNTKINSLVQELLDNDDKNNKMINFYKDYIKYKWYIKCNFKNIDLISFVTITNLLTNKTIDKFEINWEYLLEKNIFEILNIIDNFIEYISNNSILEDTLILDVASYKEMLNNIHHLLNFKHYNEEYSYKFDINQINSIFEDNSNKLITNQLFKIIPLSRKINKKITNINKEQINNFLKIYKKKKISFIEHINKINIFIEQKDLYITYEKEKHNIYNILNLKKNINYNLLKYFIKNTKNNLFLDIIKIYIIIKLYVLKKTNELKYPTKIINTNILNYIFNNEQITNMNLLIKQFTINDIISLKLVDIIIVLHLFNNKNTH